ncbi:PREDICTED: odorant receptor 4-like isoform X2 [Vollenhovia emeryi]|uniref:odorant receptor 4-like isoform X2 n=1 Tax=Vollenhovia emeryi TaxID=411798 RepID=UPI0005F38EF9|nr:PREDICTED: odorant receptor 4-like isoform X2 [Vollenhovia emeryi]
MICVTTQHFGYHRILLLAIGLWPYQQSKLVQFQLMLCYGIVISFIVAQFSVFMSAECTVNIAIKVLSTALCFTMYMIEYNSFRINAQIVKGFLEELQDICNELKDENEIAIIKRYGNIAKRYTAIVTFFYITNCTSVILLPILPFIPGLGFINESRQRHAIKTVMPVYYVNQEKYFYLLLLHAVTTMLIGGTALVGTGMMLIGYMKHACGMFRIASYRIKKALMVNMVENISSKDEIIIYKKIILAIDIHRKAIKLVFFLLIFNNIKNNIFNFLICLRFSELLFSNFQGSHFLVIVVGVICLSLNLYGISETAALRGDTERFVIHLLIIGVMFAYLFIANYAGQEITDHNDHVFSTAYNVQWYIAPLHIQKLILFLLQRGSKTLTLQLGGIFILSLEFFATLTKASISYFTVVYSTQQ